MKLEHPLQMSWKSV